MILRHGETIVGYGRASLRHGESGVPGTLTLSTLRLVFETGGATPYTVLDLDLSNIWNVHAGTEQAGFMRPARDYLTLETTTGRSVFELGEARRWADSIIQTKSSHPSSLPPPPPPPPPPPSAHNASWSGQPVVINVAAPPAPKVMLNCRFCGAMYDATLGRCDRCGARPA
ncbi:MAG TPA: hypothetical protein VEY07_08740 [Thermoplasmata archaeon]|nr:hypothetical protein [Thermoplasmata archaeon]